VTRKDYRGGGGRAPHRAPASRHADRVEAAERLFAGPGEMRAVCRARDWASTPLGPVEGWTLSLRAVAGLVLASPVAMVVLWGRDLAQIYNHGYREVMGAKHPAGVGQPTRDCWPEVWDFNAPLYAGVLERGESFTFTDQRLVVLRDGGPEEAFFTLSYSPVPDDDGSVGGVLVTVVETTGEVRARGARERERERLLAESEAARETAEAAAAAAASSEARYHALFRSLDVGFCVMELIFEDDRPVDYRFLEANPAFERQTGLVGVVGRTARELVPTLESHWFETYGRVARTGESVHFQNGSDPMGRWFDVHAFRIGAPEERQVALLFTDVTAARAAERERERLLEAERVARGEAEAANRAKSDFLAVMSHELRTPLNAINGYTDLLEMGIYGPVTDPQRGALERIQTSQQHLLGLINEVLNYAKLESGSVQYDLAEVRVAEALATIGALVEPQARERNLALEIGESPPDLAVRADREKLRQILVNLLGNAVKFTDPGGRIEVACERAADGVRFVVRDSGIGIEPDKLESIFEPFVQVRADLTRTAAGTGLGLAISRDLARGMGGDLVAGSVPGKGSTFTLTLPVARRA
jgi:signal transduction histidine kinase